jgi:endonuclease YncB( thermonuclease family)
VTAVPPDDALTGATRTNAVAIPQAKVRMRLMGSQRRTDSGRVTRVPRAALVTAAVLFLFAGLFAASDTPAALRGATYRIDHVTDGDTVVLRNGERVRLVQIDTPEVFFGTECYGPEASAITERLLPPGTRVRLSVEPATDRIDDYGRLLRYVVRAHDGINVNVTLVAVGAAAPYFYKGRRGKYAVQLETLAKRARTRHLGLWGECRHTPYDPYAGIETRR